MNQQDRNDMTSIFEIRREMEETKNSVKIDMILRHIERYLDKLEKHEDLMAGGKELIKFTSIELKLYCSVRRVKSDGPLP